MAIKNKTYRDMEFNSYVEDPSRPTLPARSVVVANASQLGGGLPFNWDSFLIDRSDSLDDVYTYSLSATPTGQVTITYTDSTKCIILGGAIVVL